MGNTTINTTVAIDIRGFCDKCKIRITERRLCYPIAGAGADTDNEYRIVLHKDLTEEQKRVVIASILAGCLEEGCRTDCLMTDCRDDELARIARRLLLPERPFRAEYDRLESLGNGLRLSALAVRFDVPLTEVLARIHDLALD